MRDRQLFLILLGLLFGLGLGLWYLSGQSSGAVSAGANPNPDSLEAAPRAGFRAPDFELETLAGELIRLSDLRGQVVLINFWATWCGPCRVEMPDIQEKYEVHNPDVIVLAVNMDESPELIEPYVRELGLTFPVLLDPGGKVNSDLYNVRGYPTSFFIDREGIIRVLHIGLMTPGQITGYLEEVDISE